MAGIPKEHDELYFDKLCRTQKSQTVLSLIQATYHAKRNLKTGENVRDAIAKRLVSAYELFKDNPKGTDTGAGTYTGDYKQFESQYTIGHELCIWKNSNLDLIDLALKVAKNEITIKDYFDVFFLNYFQPIDGKAVHILYSILTYMKNNQSVEIEKREIPIALCVTCSSEMINALCYFLDGTSYLNYHDDKLIFVGKDSLVSVLERCNIRYIGVNGLALARSELDTDEKYAEYITTENKNKKNEVGKKDIKELIKEKYEAHTDFDINIVNEKYSRFKSLYGKDVISSLSGKDLLYRLFANKEMDENSLIYNIEHNNYYRGFGGIGGGSAFKYPLFFYSKTHTWVKGTRKNHVELTESEAISKAEELRDKLVSLFDAVEEIRPFDSVEKYQQLEAIMFSDSLFNKQWVLKYLHMLYPDFFSTFYSSEWIKNVADKLGIKSEGGNVSLNGQISLVADELEIPNVFFAHVIYELLDFNGDEDVVDDEDEIEEDDVTESKELPTRSSRVSKIHPLNEILYGAPGTGKTYATVEYAVAIIMNKDISDIKTEYKNRRMDLMNIYRKFQDSGKIIFTTFHQSYGYEDFIQGLRPKTKDGAMEFKPVDGVFKRIADKALNDPDPNSNYVIIIDEINRANMSKVLGELITLIEEDKRWGEKHQLSITLPSGEVFVVPNNLYIIGTMNSSDKSISLIDAALRRRFEFIEIYPDSNLIDDGDLKNMFEKLNEELSDKLKSTDLLVGHSFFIDKRIDDLPKIMNGKIIPLLYEYFFDNKKSVKEVLEKCIDNSMFKIEDDNIRRIWIRKI